MQSDVPNPYQAPVASVATPVAAPLPKSASAVDHELALFAPPAVKLMLMSVSTLGLYSLYWFYRNWTAINRINNGNAWPFWRAVFAPLWSYSCFKAMAGIAEGRRRTLGFSPALLAITFFLLNLSGRLPTPYWVLYLLLFAPLLPVNSIARAFNQAERIGDQAAEEYSVWNWLAIVIGGGLVTLGFIGLLLS
jgi:hypothetical protein